MERQVFSIMKFRHCFKQKMPTSKMSTIFLTNQNQIINNQFITLQRSYCFGFFAVKDLLLLCWSYVKNFLNQEIDMNSRHSTLSKYGVFLSKHDRFVVVNHYFSFCVDFYGPSQNHSFQITSFHNKILNRMAV